MAQPIPEQVRPAETPGIAGKPEVTWDKRELGPVAQQIPETGKGQVQEMSKAKTGHRVPPNVASAINCMANVCRWTASQYLAAALFFSDQQLNGFGSFFKHRADLDSEKSVFLFEYLIKRNATPRVDNIEQVKNNWKSAEECVANLYNVEVEKSNRTNELFALSRQESDPHSQIMLHPTITKQVETCDMLYDLLVKTRFHEQTPGMIFRLDKDLYRRDAPLGPLLTKGAVPLTPHTIAPQVAPQVAPVISRLIS